MGPSALPPRVRPALAAAAAVFGAGDDDDDATRIAAAATAAAPPKSAMAAIMEQETRRKAAADAAAAAASAAAVAARGGERRAEWLCCGIVVKVLNRTLGGGKYHKQKGVVRALDSGVVARVEMLQSGDVLSLDQDDLETVLPPVGGPLRVVNGAHRGARATLLSINEARFCVRVELADGARRGEVIDGVEYEDVCKLHVG